MSEPGTQHDEEPQDERGAPGSRDTGSHLSSEGPANRPSGTSDADDSTSIDPQEPDEGSPTLHTP